jgi:hypothetical protein
MCRVRLDRTKWDGTGRGVQPTRHTTGRGHGNGKLVFWGSVGRLLRGVRVDTGITRVMAGG